MTLTDPEDSGMQMPPRDSGPRDSGSSDASGDSGRDSGGPSSGDAMPTGAIAFFESECPGGWQPYADAVGRTIVPNAAGITGVVSGSAYAPGENRIHNHAIDFSVTLPSVSYVLVAGCCNTGVAGSRTVSPSGTSNPEGVSVPYVQYMACEKVDAPIAGTIPTGLTAYFEEASCPATWSKLGLTAGRFVIGSPNGGATDTTFGGAALASAEARTHSHPISASWTPASHGITGLSGCCGDGYASSGNRSYSGTSGTNDATPPYLQLTHCRKQ